MSPASLLCAPAERAGAPPTERLVLVVDDDARVRDTVGAALEFEGYSVLHAADGAEALAALAAGALPCLILLDMRMPVLNGWEFASRYRQLHATHAPIVVMTAAHDAHAWAREVAADGVLPKPFDLTDLDAILRRYCS